MSGGIRTHERETLFMTHADVGLISMEDVIGVANVPDCASDALA